MSSAPLKPIYHTSQSIANEAGPSKVQDVAMGDVDAQGHADNETELVTVKRIYSFAGQRTTEERQVPRVSLFQYLSDGWKAVEPRAQESGDADSKVDGADAEDAQSKVRRPLRRPSRFDPNPTGQVRGLPPEYQLTWPRKITAMVQVDQENVPAPATPAVLRLEKAQKLNVVDKSRLDWTGYVDKEGIAEELDEHGKAKEAYLGRMEFLAGVEARREEERRRFKNLAAS
ncbi:BCNT-domain-containing protein [Zopfia rhizophila CBS 207.26]|uniref:SWR1-complex protein 5 n=1 Tax=Zopfia rhizophila CBS 207.26 TaxID=1314779 RepID=A0A6A6EXA1_9PEZI|nr:BCNT-domain-containing protein [Zopfia rhizophila CBS 207.26]